VQQDAEVERAACDAYFVEENWTDAIGDSHAEPAWDTSDDADATQDLTFAAVGGFAILGTWASDPRRDQGRRTIITRRQNGSPYG
jgi:hypothetical protein